MSRTSMVTEQRFEDDYANGYDEWGGRSGISNGRPQRRRVRCRPRLRDFTRFMQAVIDGRGLPKPAREAMLTPQIQIVSKRQFPTRARYSYHRREQSHPPELRTRLGAVLDSVRQSLLQRRARRRLSPLHGCVRQAEGRHRHHDQQFQRRRHLQRSPRISAREHLYSDRMGGLHSLTANCRRASPCPSTPRSRFDSSPPRPDWRAGTQFQDVVLKITRQDGHRLLQENQETHLVSYFLEAELQFFQQDLR